MLAVIDETTPFIAGGVHYAVVSAILLTDEAEARSVVRAVLPPHRRRPFHWHQEGIVAKTAMESAIAKIGVVAHAVVVPCGRRRQEAARAVAMEQTIIHLLNEGCDRVIIEKRTPAQDGRERSRMVRLLLKLEASGELAYDWINKSEPLLWLADALGGAVHDHLVGHVDEDRWYDRLAKRTGLTITYRCLPLQQ